jgi:general stress protein 26
MACGGSRPRVSAVKRNDRVCVVISDKRPNASVTVTLKGRSHGHEDTQTKHWFFEQQALRAFPDNEMARQGMMEMLDTPGRVVLQVNPEKTFSFDLAKLFRAAAGSGSSAS